VVAVAVVVPNDPLTCNLEVGLVAPIPTLPVESITNLSLVPRPVVDILNLSASESSIPRVKVLVPSASWRPIYESVSVPKLVMANPEVAVALWIFKRSSGVVSPIPTLPLASTMKGEVSLAASFILKLVPEPVFSIRAATWVAAPAALTLKGAVVFKVPVSEINNKFPVLAALDPESVRDCREPVSPVAEEARANPVPEVSAFAFMANPV